MKPASVLLLASIATCSLLAGCGARELPTLPPAPVILELPDCPVPPRPVLPSVDGTEPLDSPANVEALLERDDTLRLYISGLEATTECYSRRKE